MRFARERDALTTLVCEQHDHSVVQLALRTVTRVADGLGHRTLELRCVLPRAVEKATVTALEDAGKAFGVTFAMTPGMVRWV